MTNQEKSMLVHLLNVYQHELISAPTECKYTDMYGVKHHGYKQGTKAQYNHARCIANKLSTELGKDIRSW